MIKLEASEITMFIPLPLESQYELIVKFGYNAKTDQSNQL